MNTDVPECVFDPAQTPPSLVPHGTYTMCEIYPHALHEARAHDAGAGLTHIFGGPLEADGTVRLSDEQVHPQASWSFRFQNSTALTGFDIYYETEEWSPGILYSLISTIYFGNTHLSLSQPLLDSRLFAERFVTSCAELSGAPPVAPLDADYIQYEHAGGSDLAEIRNQAGSTQVWLASDLESLRANVCPD